jgi:hypothetical protein
MAKRSYPKKVPTRLSGVASIQALRKHWSVQQPEIVPGDELDVVTSEGTFKATVMPYSPINAHNNRERGVYEYPMWTVIFAHNHQQRTVHEIQILKPRFGPNL